MTATSNVSAEEWVIPGQPVPAARPRVSKWGTYYPKTYAAWLKTAKETLRLADESRDPGSPWEVPVVVRIDVVIEKAKSSKLAVPVGDVDNYAKGVLDALTHNNVWTDDKLVVDLRVTKRFAAKGEAPGVRISIHESAL